ncbi:SMP-30/gluconolactonase/LRE family protein [Williamsia sp. SKLECPSW1]
MKRLPVRVLLTSAMVSLVLTSGVATAVAAPSVPRTTTIGGWAENSATGPDGSVYVSDLTGSAVLRRPPGGGAFTTLRRLPNPGGLVVDGTTLYAVVGDTPVSVFTDAGGVVAVDLRTGAQRTVASGLGETNGLARLPDGRLVVTVTAGRGAGLQLIDPGTGARRLLTDAITTPNGLAVGPDGMAYVGSSVTGEITRVDPGDGATSPAARTIPSLDDFDFLPDGRIVAATNVGQISVVDLSDRSVVPFGGPMLGATSAKRSGGQVVVTTALGSVTTVAVPAPAVR